MSSILVAHWLHRLLPPSRHFRASPGTYHPKSPARNDATPSFAKGCACRDTYWCLKAARTTALVSAITGSTDRYCNQWNHVPNFSTCIAFPAVVVLLRRGHPDGPHSSCSQTGKYHFPRRVSSRQLTRQNSSGCTHLAAHRHGTIDRSWPCVHSHALSRVRTSGRKPCLTLPTARSWP